MQQIDFPWKKVFIIILNVNIFLSTVVCPVQGEVIAVKLHSGYGQYQYAEVTSLDRSKRDSRSAVNDLQGQAGEGYFLEMEIGTPPQKLNVLVDTGSSNFALAAAPDGQIDKFFLTNQSSTFKDSGTTVHVPYTQGEWTGALGTDVVQLPSLPNTTVTANVVFISKSSNFFINTSDWQGILGLAYQKISRPSGTVEPYFDTLVKQGGVDDMFSMQLCGARAVVNSDTSSAADSMNGTLLFGGISPLLYRGEFHYAPLHKETFYEVVLTDILVNNVSLGMDCKEYNFQKSIVDSGTTNLRLPARVFTALTKQIAENIDIIKLPDLVPLLFWQGVDIECWPYLDLLYSGFPTVSVAMMMSNSTYLTLTLQPQHYLRPIQDAQDSTLSGYCFKFGISPSDSGTVLGVVFMEGFYVHFDRSKKRIGFAETTCPPRDAKSVLAGQAISGPHIHQGSTLLDCAYRVPVKDDTPLMVVAYVMAGVCVVCVLPLLILVIQYQVRKCRDGHQPMDATTSDTGSLIQR